MDFKEIGLNIRNWIDSAQDREYWRALMNAVTHYASENCFTD